MKKSNTTIGKTYAVTSPNGCTVTTEDGLTLTEVEAGKQGYFVAVSGNVTLSDASAILTPVFKLAPIAFGGGGKPGWYDVLRSELAELLGADNFSLTYAWKEDKFALTLALPIDITDDQMAQVRVLLGSIPPRNLVTEIAPLPMGFSPIEYIENRLNAFIKTENNLYSDTELESEYFAGENSSYNFGALIGYNGSPYYLVFFTANKGSSVRFDYGNKQEGTSFSNIANSRFLLEVSGRTAVFNNLTHNTKQTIESTSEITEFETSDTFYVLSGERSGSWCGKVKLYSLKGSRGGVPQFNFLPALDPAGAPCLFDTVSRKAYRNVGSGHFVAGVETQKQLDAVLSGLPDLSGQDGGELHLCLSGELYKSAVASGIIEDVATAKNWQIAYDPTTKIAA